MGSILEDSLLLVWEEGSHSSLLVFTDIATQVLPFPWGPRNRQISLCHVFSALPEESPAVGLWIESNPALPSCPQSCCIASSCLTPASRAYDFPFQDQLRLKHGVCKV